MSPAALPGRPLLRLLSGAGTAGTAAGGAGVEPLTVLGLSPTKRKVGFSPGVCLGLAHCVVPSTAVMAQLGEWAGQRGAGTAGRDARGAT